eukprot:4199794-Pyramimonas_sp.AAC.1
MSGAGLLASGHVVSRPFMGIMGWAGMPFGIMGLAGMLFISMGWAGMLFCIMSGAGLLASGH